MSDVPPTSGDAARPWGADSPAPSSSSPSAESAAPAGRSGRKVLANSSTPRSSKSATAGAANAARPEFRHAKATSRKKMVLKGGVILMVVALLTVAGVAGYGWYRFNQIGRENLTLAQAQGGVQNILIVGSDSRAVVDKSDPNSAAFLTGKGADSAGQRSDTIMVARLDSKNKTIDLMSFPRDLWLPIQPSGEEERINTAFAQGKDSADGAQRLIDTIKVDFDIDINHYIEINFKSFQGITDAVGGVPLYFEKPVRDRNSGFYQYDTGCHTLKGEQALAYTRSRHLEYYDVKTKRWIEDPSADLGRITRQQFFIRTMFDRAQQKLGNLDVKAVNNIVSSTADNISLDSKFGVGDLIALGKSFKGFSGDQIQSHALPVYLDMTSGGASILRLNAAAAEEVFNVFRGLPPGTVTPGSVTVGVSSASGVKGRGADVANQLKALGYLASAVGDVTKTQSATVVKFKPGFEGQADLLARQLGGGATLQEDKTLSSKTPVVLTLGTSFTGVLPQATPAPTTTTLEGSPATTAPTGPVTTVKPGEITDFVGVLAGKPPAGTVCD